MGEISQSSVSILKNGHIWVSQTTFSESGRFSAFQIVAAPERFHKDRSCLLGHSLEKLIELGHHIWFRFLALVHPSSKLPGENRETYPIIARHAIFYFMSASTLPIFFSHCTLKIASNPSSENHIPDISEANSWGSIVIILINSAIDDQCVYRRSSPGWYEKNAR